MQHTTTDEHVIHPNNLTPGWQQELDETIQQYDQRVGRAQARAARAANDDDHDLADAWRTVAAIFASLGELAREAGQRLATLDG